MCSFLQKPNKTLLSPSEQNQTRGKATNHHAGDEARLWQSIGEHPLTALEELPGCGSAVSRGTEPVSISSYHPVLVGHPPAAGALGNFLLCLHTRDVFCKFS